MRPVDGLQFAFHSFNQREEALHPVAVVTIKPVIDLTDLGFADMPVDHAVAAAAARFVCHHTLERIGEVGRTLDLMFQVLR